MYANNAIFFPYDVIPTLRTLRGIAWQSLVERVLTLPELHEETLALMLTLIRINGCVPCETDSFRAMRGCTACAVQMLRRYKGDDDALLSEYDDALNEIRTFTAAGCAERPASIFGVLVADSTDAATSNPAFMLTPELIEGAIYDAG
ncbi:MAG: hypothetical protein SGI73_12030 [Chloroflexota bacterium]|nr:hypothetical protein [Chloroflexota bacterium]